MSRPHHSRTPLAWRLSLLALVLGALLLAYMVTYEGEPGAVPLGLVLAGAAGLLWSRRRTRRMRNDAAPP